MSPAALLKRMVCSIVLRSSVFVLLLVSITGFTQTYLPTITSFSPTTGGPGTVITITGTNFTGGINVNFGGTQSGSTTFISSTTVRAVVANGSSGAVTVSTIYGWASMPGFTFNAGCPLTPSVRISTDTTVFCPGSQVVFIAKATNGGTNPKYQWTINGIPVGANSDTLITSSLRNNDTVLAYMKSNATCLTDSSVISNRIIMTAANAVNPSVNIISSATNVCSGTIVEFNATASNAGTSPIFQWKKNGINVGTNSRAYADDGLQNGDVLSVTVTGNASCSSNPVATSNNITMTVTQSKTPSVTITSSATTICPGMTVQFSASVANAGTTPSFQWTKNGAIEDTKSSYSDNTLIDGDTIRAWIISSATTCSTSPVALSNPIVITVKNSVTPSVTITSSATSICPGTSVQFTATATNAGTSPTYQWKKNGINVGTNSPTYSDNTLRNTDVVSVALTSNAPCISNPVAISNNIVMTVTNGNTPNVTIASTKNVICEGDAVTFTATPEFGGTAPSYKWLVNGIAAGSQSNLFASSVLTDGARVSVVMTSNAACISRTNDTSNVIIMTVNTRVTPKVEISGPTLVNRGEFTILNATITNGGNNPVIQWQDSTNNTGWKDIPGGLSKTLIYAPPVNGTKVRCKLTSDASCAIVTSVLSQELVFTINLPTAVDPEPAEAHGIRAFPNPVTDFLILDSLKLSDKWETAEIISLDGRQRLVFENIRNKISLKIPVQKLSKGFYAAVLRRRNDAPVYIRFIKM